ncbi:MAG: phenylalanine--tRNA ligase subunit beta [Bacteroidales bacterium]|nr:phenylalanine--tRNA ligase subunit beta [Bacteroidales bacterium]
MKISYNWLKEYVHFNYSPQELAEILTNTGLETEGIERFESIKGGLNGVVVGKVLTCKKHPNADKLSVTTVDVGEEEPLAIVCGAPNVDEGQKVLVAKVGTTLYPENDKPFPIKKAKIRGELSEGMICAEDELGLGTSHDGIMVLDNDKQVGKPASQYFEIEEDWTIDIDLTPNRADATSHIGVARDVVAFINRMNPEEIAELKYPDDHNFKVDHNNRMIPVEIQDESACPRYSALTIDGIQVKESPVWLQNKLKAAGLRPVNNIVDATNYVMLETGHPLHPFDADKIKGEKVIVKKMPEGTTFTTLDEQKRKLSKDDLMICHADGPMCIAGVFGGIDSGIKENSKTVFLESAYFTPTTIRKTSKRHQLKTDASFRYERGTDPNVTLLALKRAAMLIKEIAGGSIASKVIDENPGNIKPWNVVLNFDKLDRLAGLHIERPVIVKILQDLGMYIVKESADILIIEVPTCKVDVKREVDIIEEILRIYGYNYISVPDKVKISLSHTNKPDRDKLTNLASDFLTANSFVEVMNNSLTAYHYHKYSKEINENQLVNVVNPLSRELNVLRQDLLFGGLENIQYNINRQVYDMMFFETGKVYKVNSELDKNEDVKKRYQEKNRLAIFLTGKRFKENWKKEDESVDFYHIKHWVLLLLKRMGINPDKLKQDKTTRDYFAEGLLLSKGKKEIAQLGKVNKMMLKAFDFEQDIYYADLAWDAIIDMTIDHQITFGPLPKFPEVRRDLAMILDKNVAFDSINQIAFDKERKILKAVRLFDVYEGQNVPEGKKSYAISFILQDKQKTLTDKQIDKTMKKLQQAFEEKLNAEIRG